MAETMVFNMLMSRAPMSGESKAAAGGSAGNSKGTFLSQDWAQMLASAMQSVETGTCGEGGQNIRESNQKRELVLSGKMGDRGTHSNVFLTAQQEAGAALNTPLITGISAEEVFGLVQTAAESSDCRSAFSLFEQGEVNEQMGIVQETSKSIRDRLRTDVFMAAAPNVLMQPAGMAQPLKREGDGQVVSDGSGPSIGLLPEQLDGGSDLFQTLTGNTGGTAGIGREKAGESSGGMKPTEVTAAKNDELFWKIADGSQQEENASGIVVSAEDDGQTQDALPSIANDASAARPSVISFLDSSNVRDVHHREASVSRLMTGASAQAEKQPAEVLVSIRGSGGVQVAGNLQESLVQDKGLGNAAGVQGSAQTSAEPVKTILFRMGEPNLMQKHGVQQQSLGIDADFQEDSTGRDATAMSQKDANNRSGFDTSGEQRDRSSTAIYAAGAKSDIQPSAVSDHAAAAPAISFQGNEMQGKNEKSGFFSGHDAQTSGMKEVPKEISSKKDVISDKNDMGMLFSPTERSIHSAGTTERQSVALSVNALGEVVEKAVVSSKGAPTEIRLTLRPENLGALNMRIGVESGQLQVHITTDNTTTRDILNHQVHLLRADLENKGLVIDKIQVEVSDARADSNAWGGGGQSSHQQRNGNDGTSFAYQPAEPVGLSVEALHTEPQPEMPTERRLSAFA